MGRDFLSDDAERDLREERALVEQGVRLAKEKKFSEARRYLLKALEVNPRCSSAASNLGNTFFEEGDLGKAEEYYKKAIIFDPDNPLPYNNLAVVLKSRGDMEGYRKYYKEYLRLKVEEVRKPKESQGIGPRKGLSALYWILIVLGMILLAKAVNTLGLY